MRLTRSIESPSTLSPWASVAVAIFVKTRGWSALCRFLVLVLAWREASAASSGNVFLCDVYGAVAFLFTCPPRVLPMGMSPPEGDGGACCSQLGMHSVEGSCQHARWRGSSHMHPEGCRPNAVYVWTLFVLAQLNCGLQFLTTRRVLMVYRDNGTSSHGQLLDSSRGRRHSR